MIDKYAYGVFNSMNFISDYKNVGIYSEMIQILVRLTNCKIYLELGVSDGNNIRMIRDHVDKCVGVDVVDLLPDKNNIEFNLMSTDDFFMRNLETFDIIFIDANHNWQYVRRDFENSLKILNEFGVIILHDTDPIVLELISSEYCSDSYHINDYIQSNHPELNIITLPICDMGLTFVMRKLDKRISKFI